MRQRSSKYASRFVMFARKLDKDSIVWDIHICYSKMCDKCEIFLFFAEFVRFSIILREAAKKSSLFLEARPLNTGGGGVKAWPLKKK